MISRRCLGVVVVVVVVVAGGGGGGGGDDRVADVDVAEPVLPQGLAQLGAGLERSDDAHVITDARDASASAL